MSINIAKEYCDCVISWEIQDNRKISSVVHCSYSQGKVDSSVSDTTGTLYSVIPDESENEFLPILLAPFLHPEMTQASYCDLKVFISPKLSVKIDRLIIISTAKMTEYFDRHGEILFLLKGVKVMGKVDSEKEDKDSNKSYNNNKSSSQWFRNEYILSVDTFEIIVRFCDYLTQNQLFIKYIGIKVVPHDWSGELWSINHTTAAAVSNTAGHASSTGSICSNTVTVNLDKVLESIQNVNNAVQILNNEIGCSHKGSNPHLPTTSFDAANLLKYRRPNSPMTSAAGSPQSNYIIGTTSRRNSDLCNLQLWLEAHLTMIELTFSKGIERLSNRISQLELQLTSPDYSQKDSNDNYNQQDSGLVNNIKTESNSPPVESASDKSSSCQRF